MLKNEYKENRSSFSTYIKSFIYFLLSSFNLHRDYVKALFRK